MKLFYATIIILVKELKIDIAIAFCIRSYACMIGATSDKASLLFRWCPKRTTFLIHSDAYLQVSSSDLSEPSERIADTRETPIIRSKQEKSMVISFWLFQFILQSALQTSNEKIIPVCSSLLFSCTCACWGWCLLVCTCWRWCLSVSLLGSNSKFRRGFYCYAVVTYCSF